MFNIQRRMWLFIFMGVIGCVHAGTTPTLNKQTATTQTATTPAITTQTATTQSVSIVQSTTSRLADLTDNRARSTTTINNKSNVDSLTAGNIKNNFINKSPITTTMIAAVVDDKVVNRNAGNMSTEVTKDSSAIIYNAVKDTLVQSKGTTTESIIDKSVNVLEASINTGKSTNDSVNGSLDIVVDSSLEGSVKVISDNKIKPDVHINHASTSIPPITDVDGLVVIPAVLNNDIPEENAIVKLHVAGDISFESKNEPKSATTESPSVEKSGQSRDKIVKTETSAHSLDIIKSVNNDKNIKEPRTGIKNRDNVPTRDELIATRADHLNFVQHRVEYPTDTNRTIESVDKQATPHDSPANTNEVPRTAIKNRDNVPTRDELIGMGADNVDLVQHRVEYPSDTNRSIEKLGNVDRLEKEPPFKASSAEMKQTITTNEVPRTDIKNRDNVPTRDELIAIGANNVDFVQHRVESPLNTNRRIGKQGNVDSLDKQATLKDLVTETKQTTTISEVPRTGIKNRDNVPTRDELIAMGADNVDLVQHRVEYPIDTNRSIEKLRNVDSLDKQATLKDSVTETKQTITTNEVPKTGIKNRSNVPTRDELIAMGADNVDLVQHRVEDTIDLSWLVKKKEVNVNGLERQNIPTESSNKTQTDINSKTQRGVKNKHNVPTRDELLAKGETNVDFVQHRVVDNFQPKRVVNNPISADENPDSLNGDVSKRQGSTSMSGTVMKSEKLNVIGQPLMKGMDTNIAESKPAPDNKATTTTTENQPETNKQIPMPKRATQTTLTNTDKQTTNGQSGSTGNVVNSLVQDTNNNGVTSEVTTHVLTTKKNEMMKTKTVCPQKNCVVICKFGYKEDANGCSTCDCQYSNSCPRAIPISRLLCLLQEGIRSSPSCAEDADCRRNRICCPGTCRTICRRESRNRSMLLSMLID